MVDIVSWFVRKGDLEPKGVSEKGNKIYNLKSKNK